MGKLSRLVKDRICLACNKTFNPSSKKLKKHFKECKG